METGADGKFGTTCVEGKRDNSVKIITFKAVSQKYHSWELSFCKSPLSLADLKFETFDIFRQIIQN